MTQATNETRITAEPNTPFIIIEREFDAPVERVFDAFVNPDLIVQWLGPRDLEMTVPTWNPVTGGSYEYVHTSKEGESFAFRGAFHSVDAPTQITQTFEFLGYPGAVNLETMTFEDLGDGRTKTRQLSVCQSVENRDGLVASGMEAGVREGFEKLDELLASGR